MPKFSPSFYSPEEGTFPFGDLCHMQSDACWPVWIVTDLDNNILISNTANSGEWRLLKARTNITRYWSCNTAFFQCTLDLHDTTSVVPKAPSGAYRFPRVEDKTTGKTSLTGDQATKTADLYAPLNILDEICIYAGYLPTLRQATVQDITDGRLLRRGVWSIDTITFSGSAATGIIWTVQCRDRLKYLMDTFGSYNTAEEGEILAGKKNGGVDVTQASSRSQVILALARRGIGDLGDGTSIGGRQIKQGFVYDIKAFQDGSIQPTATGGATTTSDFDPYKPYKGDVYYQQTQAQVAKNYVSSNDSIVTPEGSPEFLQWNDSNLLEWYKGLEQNIRTAINPEGKPVDESLVPTIKDYLLNKGSVPNQKDKTTNTVTVTGYGHTLQATTKNLPITKELKLNIITGRSSYSQNSDSYFGQNFMLADKVPLDYIKFLSQQEPWVTEVFQDHRTGEFWYSARGLDVSGLSDPKRFNRTYFFRQYPDDLTQLNQEGSSKLSGSAVNPSVSQPQIVPGTLYLDPSRPEYPKLVRAYTTFFTEAEIGDTAKYKESVAEIIKIIDDLGFPKPKPKSGTKLWYLVFDSSGEAVYWYGFVDDPWYFRVAGSFVRKEFFVPASKEDIRKYLTEKITSPVPWETQPKVTNTSTTQNEQTKLTIQTLLKEVESAVNNYGQGVGGLNLGFGLNNDQADLQTIRKKLIELKDLGIDVADFYAQVSAPNAQPTKEAITKQFIDLKSKVDTNSNTEVKAEDTSFSTTITLPGVKFPKSNPHKATMLTAFREENSAVSMRTNIIVQSHNSSGDQSQLAKVLHLAVEPPFLKDRAYPCSFFTITDDTASTSTGAMVAVALAYARLVAKELRAAAATLLGDPSITPGEVIQVLGSPAHSDIVTNIDKIKGDKQQLIDMYGQYDLLGQNMASIAATNSNDTAVTLPKIDKIAQTPSGNAPSLIAKSGEDITNIMQSAQSDKEVNHIQYLPEPVTMWRVDGVVDRYNDGVAGYYTEVSLLSCF